MAVDRLADGPAGDVEDEVTTDDERARAQLMPHVLAAPSSGEVGGTPPPPHDGGGAPTPMAVDPVEPPGAAAMRASDEMQQTTIGRDSDVDESELPRRRRTRGRGPKGCATRRAVARKAAAAAATGNEELTR